MQIIGTARILTRARELLRTCWLTLTVFMMMAAAADHASAERRIALVIGNAKFEKLTPLRNSQRDAAAIADRLRNLGFEVTEVFDGDAFTLNRAAERFVASARGVDLAVFYFAGHGVQLFDRNVLLARDADPASAVRIDDLGLDLVRLMGELRLSGSVRQAFLIDACRDNPIPFETTVRLLERLQTNSSAPQVTARSAAPSRGLTAVPLPRQNGATGETLMFFAAQPGEVSFDGVGQNSYYVEGLKEELSKPDRPLSEIFRAVSAYVRTVTNGQQVPQIVSDWTADVMLGVRAVTRITYDVISSSGRALNAADRDLVIKNATGFAKLRGVFDAQVSIGDIADSSLDDEQQKRAKELGTLNGFSLTYDLDRDGRDEIIRVYFRQLGYVLTLETQGVVAEIGNCIDDAATGLTIGLRDINGDRKPELFIGFETERTTGWGKFCVLEYRGLPDIASRRRDNTGKINSGYSAFRTLLRGDSGWNVTISNDNTIKSCGGSGCATSWTWKFDGSKFTFINDQGEVPAGAAALPFGDETERARNLFAGLSRATVPVTAQGWQLGRQDNAVSARGRIDQRTELAIECQRSGDGSAYEIITIRDKPLQGAAGGATISLEPTLAYGESATSAPVLIDGVACTTEDVSDQDGLIRIAFSERDASGCFDRLERASAITLPVLHGKGKLLGVQLGAGGQTIAQARRVCRGPSVAAAPDAGLPANPPPVPRQSVKGSLDARARAFIADYMRQTEGAPADVISYMRHQFAGDVSYYGKRVKAEQVIEDKQRYLNRWPVRSYALKDDTILIVCNEAQAACQISGELTFRAADPASARVSDGNASFNLRVIFTGSGQRIVEESGRTLARSR